MKKKLEKEMNISNNLLRFKNKHDHLLETYVARDLKILNNRIIYLGPSVVLYTYGHLLVVYLTFCARSAKPE